MKDKIYDNMYEMETFHWWSRAKREIVLALAAPYLKSIGNGVIVDFGCGCGAMLTELEPYGKVVGLDYSPRALDYCRRRFSGELHCMDLSAPLSAKMNSIQNKSDNPNMGEIGSIGFALDILEHIDDDLAAAKNIHSLLRPGGVCVITVPAHQWLWSTHDENCMHKRRYGKRQFRQLMEEAGFRVEFLSWYNCFLFLPAAIVRLLCRIFPLDRDSALETRGRDSLLNSLL